MKPLMMAGVLAVFATMAAAQQGAQVQAPRDVPSGPEALIGPFWKLTAVGDVKPADSNGEREPHLQFYAGGTVVGWDGCNSIRSTYQVGDDALKFGALMGTLMNCPIPDKLDRRLREALVITRGWKLTNGELALLDDKGAVLARFQPRADR